MFADLHDLVFAPYNFSKALVKFMTANALAPTLSILSLFQLLMMEQRAPPLFATRLFRFTESGPPYMSNYFFNFAFQLQEILLPLIHLTVQVSTNWRSKLFRPSIGILVLHTVPLRSLARRPSLNSRHPRPLLHLVFPIKYLPQLLLKLLSLQKKMRRHQQPITALILQRALLLKSPNLPLIAFFQSPSRNVQHPLPLLDLGPHNHANVVEGEFAGVG